MLKRQGALVDIMNSGYLRDYGWAGRLVQGYSYLRQCVGYLCRGPGAAVRVCVLVACTYPLVRSPTHALYTSS